MTRLGPSDVLVVDDRADTLDELITEFQLLGIQPMVISGYEEAVRYIDQLDSWAGLGLIDVRLPSSRDTDGNWLGLDLGAQIRARFGPSAKFAYVTAVVSMVPTAEYQRAAATSILGVIDKFHYSPRDVASAAVREMGVEGDAG